jgi:cation diffusion facilitator CzcD-associated flavoprotein CzcO
MNSPETTNASGNTRKHKTLIIGGGSAGICVAARLRRE